MVLCNDTSASFRATGMCSFDKEAIHVPEVSKSTPEEFDTGVISYWPLYSPAPKRYSAQYASALKLSLPDDDPLQAVSPDFIRKPAFSKAEEELFQTRWENGYDLTTYHRYNLWVSVKESVEDKSFISAKETKADQSALQELLQIPEQPAALKKNSERKFRSAHVLTSKPSLQRIEERERRKRGRSTAAAK